MIYIESKSTNPYYNLALEEYVFERMDRSKDYFILWQNYNTIVVGKYQNTAEEINQEYVNEHGIRVVRRLSGGGAVYHDKGNLNYTFIVGQDKNPEFDFSLFSTPVIKALDKLGVKASLNGRNDISIDGKKFCGNSQYAKHKRLLHHGCIMLDSNLGTVADALKVKEAKFDSKSVKSVQSRVTTINANAPRTISMEEFKETLKACAFENEELEEYKLSIVDEAEIMHLKKEKYEIWDWVYGKNPDYNVTYEKKFPSGLVTLKMQVENACIDDIKIYGDFFGNGEIQELEDQIRGMKIDQSLKENLNTLDVGYYMSGITADDLYQMII